jgi:hypothetical protein
MVFIKSIRFFQYSFNAFEEKDLAWKRISDSFGIPCSLFSQSSTIPSIPLACKRWSGCISPGKIFDNTNARW